MYETYFNLKGQPFASAARIDHYFPAPPIEAARASLVRCVERAEGIGMVVGPPGSGKTLLCHLLAEQLKAAFSVALLASGRLASRRGLLQAVSYELGLPFRGMDEGELRLMLVDHATLSDDCPRGIVVLVDEAHAVPLRLLDEARMLTDLVRDGQPAVRLVLAGSRALEERLASPRLESLVQRLTARCYLEPLGRLETQGYIHTRIAAVGGPAPAIFPPETCQSVYKATDGVPRLINQVCDHAMLLAYRAGCRQVTPAQIEEAWADLQQLPTPSSEPSQNAGDGVVEFGGLEDAEEGSGFGVQGSGFGAKGSGADGNDGRAGKMSVGNGEFTAVPAGPTLHISPETQESALGEMDLEDQLSQIRRILSDVEDEFPPAAPAGSAVEPACDEPGQSSQGEFETEKVIAAEAGPGEPDLLLVEEGCDNESPWPGPPVVALRRREYGRLFARLRGA
jgi:type II secretory pathway predicted ATPase ExeA